MSPVIEPQPKYRYTARISILIDHPDVTRAFQVATELLQRAGLSGYAGPLYDGVPFSEFKIEQATVERQEPKPERWKLVEGGLAP